MSGGRPGEKRLRRGRKWQPCLHLVRTPAPQTPERSGHRGLTQQSASREATDGPAARPTTPLAVENSVGKPAAFGRPMSAMGKRVWRTPTPTLVPVGRKTGRDLCFFGVRREAKRHAAFETATSAPHDELSSAAFTPQAGANSVTVFHHARTQSGVGTSLCLRTPKGELRVPPQTPASSGMRLPFWVTTRGRFTGSRNSASGEMPSRWKIVDARSGGRSRRDSG